MQEAVTDYSNQQGHLATMKLIIINKEISIADFNSLVIVDNISWVQRT